MPCSRLPFVGPLAGPALAAGLMVLAVAAPRAAVGQDGKGLVNGDSLLAQCWKPGALAARAGENLSRRAKDRKSVV